MNLSNGTNKKMNNIMNGKSLSSAILKKKHIDINESVETPNGYMFNKSELVRLFVQTLQQIGCTHAANVLEDETGIKLHTEDILLLCNGIKEGKWKYVVKLLHGLQLTDDKVKKATLLIYEQKYLELLEVGSIEDALTCLREDLSPIILDEVDHIATLASYMLISDADSLYKESNWDGRHGKSRAKLLMKIKKIIPSYLLVPDNRLMSLLEESIQYQISNCSLHNMHNNSFSLLHSHTCELRLPKRCIATLEEHNAEVLFVVFSNNGKYMASTDASGVLIIWNCYQNKIEKHLKLMIPSAESQSQVTNSDNANNTSNDDVTVDNTSNNVNNNSNNNRSNNSNNNRRDRYERKSTYSDDDDDDDDDHSDSDSDFNDHVEEISEEIQKTALEMISWSPNNEMVAVCGESKYIYVWNIIDGVVKKIIKSHNKPVSSVVWLDNETIISGSIDRTIRFSTIEEKLVNNHVNNASNNTSNNNQNNNDNESNNNNNNNNNNNSSSDSMVVDDADVGVEMKEDNKLLNMIKTHMIQDMQITFDRKRLIVLTTNKKIQIYDLLTRKLIRTINETQLMTSLSLSLDNKYVLVSCANPPELHLWNLDNGEHVKKYDGFKQKRFVVRGSVSDYLVASGSEDSQVYLWHRVNGELLCKLSGHAATVNHICWNQQRPCLLVSASDDHTIRIWEEEEKPSSTSSSPSAAVTDAS